MQKNNPQDEITNFREESNKCPCNAVPCPPVILFPEQCQIITDIRPTIIGTAEPGNTVCICVNKECMKTVANSTGGWSIRLSCPLPEGENIITANQTNSCCRTSKNTCRIFCRQEKPCITPDPPIIVYPENDQVIFEPQPFIIGTAEPGNIVTVCIDMVCVDTAADENGNWNVTAPEPLELGTHTITAFQVNFCGAQSAPATSTFTREETPIICPVPEPPVILLPFEGEVIFEVQPFFKGTGIPGNIVMVCVSGSCESVLVDENGNWSVQSPVILDIGTHTVTAVQINECGETSEEATITFTVGEAVNELIIDDLRRGLTFRTVDATFTIGNMTGDWTVYYLLLRPDLPAPTEFEVINYDDSVTLSNGIAARGRFDVPVSEMNTTITRVFPGREVLQPLETETGVVDGIRYTLYMVGVTAASQSTGLVYSPITAIGMPFNSGDGTDSNPFTIIELTDAELAIYPDLIAGNPGNRAGINETARQLDNIEGMRVLYDENIQNGIAESLELNYSIESDFDLTGYTNAYGGSGWRPIGNYDSTFFTPELPKHIFTGTLEGINDSITIFNLPLTPAGNDEVWVQYVGFIGFAVGASVTNININGATVTPIPVLPAANSFAMRTGVLSAYANNCNFSVIRVTNAQITFDFDTITYIESGAIAGEMIGNLITQVTVSQINTMDQSAVYGYHGGVIGYSHNDNTAFSLSQTTVSGITITALAGTKDYAGGVIGYQRAALICTIQNITANDISLESLSANAGGVMGYLRINAETLVSDINADNIIIIANSSSSSAGGIVGTIASFNITAILNLQVTGSNLHSVINAGGIIGEFVIFEGAQVEINSFTATANVSVDRSYSGGVIGALYREGTSSLYIYGGEVLSGSVITGNASISGFIGDIFHTSINSFVYIQNCISAAAVTGNTNTGGLFGFANYTAINNCSFSGTVQGNTIRTGGIIGSCASIYVANCVCTGEVSGVSNLGGLIGDANNSGVLMRPDIEPPFEATVNLMELSSMRGNLNILLPGSDIGGLIGTSVGMFLSQCFSTAGFDANDSAYAGGLVGRCVLTNSGIQGEISNCYATGSIAGNSSNYGGILGGSVTVISNCYGAGSVTGLNLIGGIAGAHTNILASISTSLALGPLVSSQTVNASRIVNATSLLINNFALDTLILEQSGTPVTPVDNPNGPDGGTITPGELLDTITVIGWDTVSIWNTATIPTLGRPTLLQNPE